LPTKILTTNIRKLILRDSYNGSTAISINKTEKHEIPRITFENQCSALAVRSITRRNGKRRAVSRGDFDRTSYKINVGCFSRVAEKNTEIELENPKNRINSVFFDFLIKKDFWDSKENEEKIENNKNSPIQGIF